MKQYISGTDQLAVGAKKLKALENLGQITTAVQKLTAAVNGDGSGQDLTTGSAQLTEGLKELKTQVDELAQSSNAQQLTQLVQGLQQAKASLSALSEQTAQLTQLLQTARSMRQLQQSMKPQLPERLTEIRHQVSSLHLNSSEQWLPRSMFRMIWKT